MYNNTVHVLQVNFKKTFVPLKAAYHVYKVNRKKILWENTIHVCWSSVCLLGFLIVYFFHKNEYRGIHKNKLSYWW